MAKLLGIYVIGKQDLPLDLAQRIQPGVIVSMDHNPDYWRAIKGVCPQTTLIGRYYIPDDQQQYRTGATDGDLLFQLMRGDVEKMRGIYNGWMGWNEPNIWNDVQARALSDATVRWAQLLHGIGIQALAYSFPQGHPELNLWPYLTPGLEACDGLALHEYDAPEMDRTQGWRCLRYRQVLAQLPEALRSRLPIWILEAGIDGGALDDAHAVQGWAAFGNDQHYKESVEWYVNEASKDAQVRGIVLFAAAWDQGHGTFNVNNCPAVLNYMAALPASSPVPPVSPPAIGAGWYPAAVREPLPYCEDRKGRTVRGIVLHIADGNGDPFNYWRQAQISAHFWISKTGRVVQYVPITQAAWANGLSYAGGVWTCPHGHVVQPAWPLLEPGVNPNWTTVSIEHEGKPGEAITPQMWAAQRGLLGWLAGQMGGVYFEPFKVVIGHHQLDPIDRANDPGPTLAPDLVVANMVKPG